MGKKSGKRAAAFFVTTAMVFSMFVPFSYVQADTVVWSLNDFLSGRAVGSTVESSGDLWEAGLNGRVFVHSHNNNLGVHATGRTNSWNGIDIRASAGIQTGDVITVTGRIDGTPAAGEEARLRRAPGDTDIITAPIAANGAFTLTHTLTADEYQGLAAIRICTTGTSSFFVDTVVITRGGAAAATPTPSQSSAPLQVTRTLTSSTITTINGWDVELWTQNRNEGTVEMVIYNNGSFSCSYDDVFNVLFRTGRKFPRNTRINSLNNISIRYNAAEFTSTNVSYLSVYGWTRDTLIEWYIVENWNPVYRPGGPVGNARADSTHHGTIETDGGVYDIYTTWRINQPSIDGNRTFMQIFSVRQTPRMGGIIDVSAHFEAWKDIGEITHTEGGTTHRSHFTNNSELYEVTFKVEGFGGQNRSSGAATIDQLCVSYGSNALCTANGCINCTGVAAVVTATPTPIPSVAPSATPSPTPSTTPSPSPLPSNTPLMQFEINSLQYLNQGETAFLDEAPYIENGRTMVPFRAIAEGLGAEVSWNDATRTVTFVRNGVTANLTIDVPLPGDMGTPVIRGGRTFVPVRYVTEALNSRIEWDETTRTVSIY